MMPGWMRRLRTRAAGQLELALPPRTAVPASPVESAAQAASAAPSAPAVPATAMLARLRTLGLKRIERCTLTRNRSTMVSFQGASLRLHRAFADAPPHVLEAVVRFVNGRGAVRRDARRVLRTFEVPRAALDPARVRRRPATHPEDAALIARLEAAHAELNRERFAGALGQVAIRISRRMRSRLGHYSPGGMREPEIAIARRHIRRDGWASVLETLVHEMVHQWQHETKRPVAHDPDFRRKCREVGIPPHAKRPS